MSLISACTRTIRRKLVLLFLALLAILLITHFSSRDCYFCLEEDETIHLRKLNQPFTWDQEEEEDKGNSSTYDIVTCRNSLQGRTLVADDKGYVCERSNLEGTGCCNNNSSLGRFICTGCETRLECCTEYEYCISCCLRREQKPVLQQFLKQAADNNNVLFVSVSDHFELCLAKCRTSSASVQHENTYRNKERKYCYGKEAPPTSNSAEQ